MAGYIILILLAMMLMQVLIFYFGKWNELYSALMWSGFLTLLISFFILIIIPPTLDRNYLILYAFLFVYILIGYGIFSLIYLAIIHAIARKLRKDEDYSKGYRCWKLKQKNSKKQKIFFICFIFIVLIAGSIIGLRGKNYMAKQNENKEFIQEKQIALQIKEMFKEINKVEIQKGFEGSPGSKEFGVDIIQDSGNKFHVTVSLGDSKSYDTNDGYDVFNQEGKTEKQIQVVFSNKEKEVLK